MAENTDGSGENPPLITEEMSDNMRRAIIDSERTPCRRVLMDVGVAQDFRMGALMSIFADYDDATAEKLYSYVREKRERLSLRTGPMLVKECFPALPFAEEDVERRMRDPERWSEVTAFAPMLEPYRELVEIGRKMRDDARHEHPDQPPEVTLMVDGPHWTRHLRERWVRWTSETFGVVPVETVSGTHEDLDDGRLEKHDVFIVDLFERLLARDPLIRFANNVDADKRTVMAPRRVDPVQLIRLADEGIPLNEAITDTETYFNTVFRFKMLGRGLL